MPQVGAMVDPQHGQSADDAVQQRLPPDPNVAALLSVVIPGAGHIYAGAFIRGILFMLAAGLGYVLLLVPGLLVHTVAIVSAYSNARKIARQHGPWPLPAGQRPQLGGRARAATTQPLTPAPVQGKPAAALAPRVQAADLTPATALAEVAERFRRVERLKGNGIIDADEFTARKQELIAELHGVRVEGTGGDLELALRELTETELLSPAEGNALRATLRPTQRIR